MQLERSGYVHTCASIAAPVLGVHFVRLHSRQLSVVGFTIRIRADFLVDMIQGVRKKQLRVVNCRFMKFMEFVSQAPRKAFFNELSCMCFICVLFYLATVF